MLYFYPKDATAGCTTEAGEFRDLHGRFARAGAVVFGVSRDSIRSHEKFRERQALPFHLLSDPDERLCRLFDVIREKSLYGRKFMGIERSTFVIDRKGTLVFMLEPKFDTPTSYQKDVELVLDELRKAAR